MSRPGELISVLSGGVGTIAATAMVLAAAFIRRL